MDLKEWEAQNLAFLTLVGQVEVKTKPSTKKDEE